MFRLRSVALALALTACGGAIAPTSSDEPEATPATPTESPPSRPSKPPSSLPPPPPRVDPAPPSPFAPSGECATYTAGSASLGAGDFGCQVVTREGASFRHVTTGSAGGAELDDETLVLWCGEGTRVFFQAALRCFQGSGDYTIAPGDLKLGDELSNRSCTVSLQLGSDHVRGFISCDDPLDDPTDIFAQTLAPVGIGSFMLKRAF
ncbi:MAG: hypothetical protein KIT84_23630 [Labilithrix sp.]|nr:hypothetical protein [Labilithrix sp.]MCW5814040.1 hypothetical protein [Labilithrix sp.]